MHFAIVLVHKAIIVIVIAVVIMDRKCSFIQIDDEEKNFETFSLLQSLALGIFITIKIHKKTNFSLRPHFHLLFALN